MKELILNYEDSGYWINGKRMNTEFTILTRKNGKLEVDSKFLDEQLELKNIFVKQFGEDKIEEYIPINIFEHLCKLYGMNSRGVSSKFIKFENIPIENKS